MGPYCGIIRTIFIQITPPPGAESVFAFAAGFRAPTLSAFFSAKSGLVMKIRSAPSAKTLYSLLREIGYA
jgi:hypothetical protein